MEDILSRRRFCVLIVVYVAIYTIIFFTFGSVTGRSAWSKIRRNHQASVGRFEGKIILVVSSSARNQIVG